MAHDDDPPSGGLDNLFSVIGVMTAWQQIKHGGGWGPLDDILDDVDGHHDLLMGLISFAGGLLTWREAEVGVPPAETLRQLAAVAARAAAST